MRLCDEQMKHLQWSLQKKQDSSLHQAIIKGGNSYMYLGILHAAVADISFDDCNKGTTRKWGWKALYDLIQQSVNKEALEN